MTLDLHVILESKRAHRATLAAKPIAEKLRLLDAMRERAVVIRSSSGSANVVREKRADYRTLKRP